LVPLVLGLLTILMTIGVHAVALAAAAEFIRVEYRFRRAGIRFWTDVAIVAGITLLALIAHLVEIAIWAVLYLACGEFSGLPAVFYPWAVTYPSLGLGDVVLSVPWSLRGPRGAADGLLMFGVSTAMIFAAMQRLFVTRVRAARTAHRGH